MSRFLWFTVYYKIIPTGHLQTYFITNEAADLHGSELRIKLSLATLSVRYCGASNGSRMHFKISATV